MAMITDAFVGKCVEALVDLAKDEVVMILGVKDDLQRLQEKMEDIRDVLLDAERRRIQDRAIKRWLSKLKDVLYDADDIIDLCKIKSLRLLAGDQLSPASPSASSVRSLFPSLLSCCTSILFRHQIGERILKITSRLEKISKDKLELNLEHFSPVVHVTQVDLRHTSSLTPPNVVGTQVEDATNKLVGLLREENESLLVYAIAGMGGIGKTTVAQKIYNHKDVLASFEIRLWLCVSQNYTETELLKQLIREVERDRDIPQSKEELLRLLNTTISGKRFFLVLDDVWRADVWEDLLRSPLQNGGPGSKILVTTRNTNVAESMRASHIYQVNKLSPLDGWKLLSKSVFKNEADADMHSLQEIGMQIVQKCHGLPLAIKAIGGILRTKRGIKREWEKVYQSHAWSIEGDIPEAVRGALYLSYEELPSQLKQCFLYCSLFPEDHWFDRDDLTRLWVSEGFVTEQNGLLLEDTAEDYYYELISRNLLNPGLRRERCKMHDVVRSLAIFLAHDESCFIEAGGSSTKSLSKCRRLGIGSKLESIHYPKQLRTLIFHNQVNVNVEDLCGKHRHLRVLDLSGSSIDCIPSSIRNLLHLRHLDLNSTAIRELPKSIGCLSLLLTLNISFCKLLHVLPESITQLHNLRCLIVRKTPISHIPSGIGKLKDLNDMDGFVVGEGYDEESGAQQEEEQQQQRGCSLNELQSLSKIRRILIDKLERASTTGSRIRPLKDKTHLKELTLVCTQNHAAVEDSMRIEQIFEDLCPSVTLESLTVWYFYGLKFPRWLFNLTNLRHLNLSGCFYNCSQLPALGNLPELQTLWLGGGKAVTKIGVECLGCVDTNDGVRLLVVAFPKLEELGLSGFQNLEEWTWDVEAAAAASAGESNIIILPHLQSLLIAYSPKLRALPDCLRHTSALKELTIRNAHSLTEVESLSSSLEKLTVADCRSLARISNLPGLEELRIDCASGALVSIENLNSLRRLILDDRWIECLPQCLLGLIRMSFTDNGTLRMFVLRCNKNLGERCRPGGEYWPLLQHIQHLQLQVYKD